VAAGSVVTGKIDAPDGSLILGNPATVVKPLKPEQIEATRQNGLHYIELAQKQLEIIE
jgi:carbonic anhydrase/acetyltransferase-like protein (isoleucine patch superfamily)